MNVLVAHAETGFLFANVLRISRDTAHDSGAQHLQRFAADLSHKIQISWEVDYYHIMNENELQDAESSKEQQLEP